MTIYGKLVQIIIVNYCAEGRYLIVFLLMMCGENFVGGVSGAQDSTYNSYKVWEM